MARVMDDSDEMLKIWMVADPGLPRPAETSFWMNRWLGKPFETTTVEEYHRMVPIWNAIKPVGKLTRAHFVGSAEKRYVDERGQLFLVHFYPRQVVFLCNVTME